MCTSCALCKKPNAKYTHPIQLSSDQQVGLKLKEYEPNIPETACICLPCAKQLKRLVTNPTLRPRWFPKATKLPQKCGAEKCTNMVHKSTNLVSVDELERLLGVRVVAFDAGLGQPSVGLCQSHYQKMFFQVHQRRPCESCGVKPRKGEQFTRHCPSPQAINHYLNHITTESSTLNKSSLICYACYKHFNCILREIQSTEEPVLENTDNIDSAAANIAAEMERIQSLSPMAAREYFDLIMCEIAMKVFHAMRSHEALLLPVVHRDFVHRVRERWTQHFEGEGGVPEDEIPSTRWLLAQLHFFLGDLLQVKCKHRRYGSVLFYRDCDLIKALSTALGKSQDHQKSPQPVSSIPEPSLDRQVDSVASYLNEKVHTQAKALVSEFQGSPSKYTTLNLAAFQQSLDPTLLSFIQQLTQSVRSRKRKLFESESDVANTKHIRQLYALCTLFFCTNNQCSMPFHFPLSDAILCHGGSLELLRILNRVGAVASIDTNSRLATQVSHERIQQGIEPDVIPRTLTVVSIDNVDILQPHAFVSSTDATRSWHGTSVQCVQPLPNSCTATDDEIRSRPPQSRKQPASSPIASPIPVEKCKRRRRTLKEMPSPHSSICVPTVTTRVLTDITDEPDNQYTHRVLSTCDFLLNTMEKANTTAIKSDLLKCLFLKHVQSLTDESPLPGIPSLINCVRAQAVEREVGNIVYIQISSERADCKETLVTIIGKLHQVFCSELHYKWLLVVGDAKTYDLLQSIKFEYGTHLKWLVPFPGDWHILLNYQKVLMKVYADAGLKQLGSVSGHKSETLTSLIQCSNFRRTHHFLLQSFEAIMRFFISLYLEDRSSSDMTASQVNLKEQIETSLLQLVHEFSRITHDDQLPQFRSKVSDLFSGELTTTLSDFTDFIDDLANKQDTIKFWHRFAMWDCFAYIALYTGI